MPIDNAFVDLTITDPNGTVSHVGITTDCDGKADCAPVFDKPGRYLIVGTSQSVASETFEIIVAPAPKAMQTSMMGVAEADDTPELPVLNVLPASMNANVGDPVPISIALVQPDNVPSGTAVTDEATVMALTPSK